MPDISSERIADLAQQLIDLRLPELESPNTIMTATGAGNLRGTVTPYGREFVKYITDVD